MKLKGDIAEATLKVASLIKENEEREKKKIQDTRAGRLFKAEVDGLRKKGSFNHVTDKLLSSEKELCLESHQLPKKQKVTMRRQDFPR